MTYAGLPWSERNFSADRNYGGRAILAGTGRAFDLTRMSFEDRQNLNVVRQQQNKRMLDASGDRVSGNLPIDDSERTVSTA